MRTHCYGTVWFLPAVYGKNPLRASCLVEPNSEEQGKVGGSEGGRRKHKKQVRMEEDHLGEKQFQGGLMAIVERKSKRGNNRSTRTINGECERAKAAEASC